MEPGLLPNGKQYPSSSASEKLEKTGVARDMDNWLSPANKLSDRVTVPRTAQNIPHVVSQDLGLTPLMRACSENKAGEVEIILACTLNVDEVDSDGRTALLFAVSKASRPVVECLLKARADPFVLAGDFERNCLHFACSRPSGAIDIVRLLVATMGENAKLFQDKAGLIPLHLAIMAGGKHVIQELLGSLVAEQVKAATLEYQDTAIHLAARGKDVDLLKLIVEAGGSVNAANGIGQTALHIAALEGDQDSITYLHSLNSSLTVKDKVGRTPLHLATEAGNIGTIELLVEKCNADVTQRYKEGSTYLHLAAKFGHSEVAAYFLKHGLTLFMANEDGAIALHEAARQGHVNTVKYLISLGSPIEVLSKEGFTPLHSSVRFGKYLVAEALLGAGADVNKAGGKLLDTPLHLAAKLSRHSEVVCEVLINSGAHINALNRARETPLAVAISYGNLSVVSSLISHGADVTTKNECGETPLMLAVKKISSAMVLEVIDSMKSLGEKDFADAINEGNTDGETALHYVARIQLKAESRRACLDICSLLLSNNHLLTPETSVMGETPLHCCCRNGNSEIIEMILSKMSPKDASRAVNQQTKAGWSGLMVACQSGHTSVVRLLLQYQARVDVFDEFGKAALHIAAENGHIGCCELLVKSKAYVDAKTKLGLTAVGLAAANGHDAVIDMLVARCKASHSILPLNKRSALHLAAEHGHLTSCITLLDLGAEPRVSDVNGLYPIHCAAEENHPDIVKMFLDRFPDLGATPNKAGNSCAHIAAQRGSMDVMKALLKNDLTTAVRKNKVTLQCPVHLACAGGHVGLIQLLLDNGASLSDEDHEGMTPLHLACKFGQRNVIEILKGKISFDSPSAKTGMKPLHIAAEFDQVGCLSDLLLTVQGNTLSECPEKQNPDTAEFGLSALHFAAKNGHEAVVRLLINSDGVKVDQATTNRRLIPLHMAVVSGHADVASLLISRSADLINVRCAEGRTALHFASAHGHLQLVGLALGQGADINAKDSRGWTALHYAADAGHVDVVKRLVQMDASLETDENEFKSPLAFAARNRHLDVMEFLLSSDFQAEDLMQDRKFICHLMICSKMNENRSIQDFIINSKVPIYTAIKLTIMYRLESLKVKDKSQDFMEMAAFCEAMALELLHIATSFDTENLLNAVDDANVALLDILIDNEFKDCVAHANVQSYLSDVWGGDSIQIEGIFGILVALLCFACPPLWLFLSLPVSKYNRIPTLKFICHIVSHLYFIIIMILVVAVPWDRSYLMTYPTPYEWALVVWLTGIVMQHLTEQSSSRMRVVILFLSAVALVLNLCAVFLADGRLRENLMYARDNVLAVVLLLLVLQMLQFLSLNEMFGPFSVLIQALMLDVVRFFVILMLFMIGFALHLAVVLKPVYDKAPVHFTTQLTDFAIRKDFQSIITDLFYACFGMGYKPAATDEMLLTNPGETLIIATILYLLYQIIAVIVLVNLLVAMMGNTFSRLDERSSIEWKYQRALIVRDMCKPQLVPAPVNIITAFSVVVRAVVSTRCCCCLKKPIVGESRGEDLLKNEDIRQNDDEEFAGDYSARAHIANVVNWKLVIKSYYESKGIVKPGLEFADGEHDGQTKATSLG